MERSRFLAAHCGAAPIIIPSAEQDVGVNGSGFTREIEEATDILGFDATNAVAECGLE